MVNFTIESDLISESLFEAIQYMQLENTLCSLLYN